ncbi:MAG: undecaprenyl-phosphate glucose phosphotransferase [Halothiobacillaceae bacterium]|jgi:putative colanic acid biosynthesis UDP-glucose lipid carrier transferase
MSLKIFHKPHIDNLIFILKGLDATMVWMGGVTAYLWRFGTANFSLPLNYALVMITGSLGMIITLQGLGIYRSWRGNDLLNMLGQVILAWLLTLLALLALLTLLKASSELSRAWLAAWALSTTALLILGRSCIYLGLRWLRLRGLNHKRVVLVGCSEMARELRSRIQSAAWTGFDILAVFDAQSHQEDAVAQGCTAGLEDLLPYLHQHHVHEVWITLPLRDEQGLRKVLDLLQQSTVTIRYAPDLFALRLITHSISEIAGVPMLDLSINPMSGIRGWIKDIEDRFLAALILLLISPLMLAIALAVKLSSPGPVLFKQRRMGWDGRPIVIYKFRTMIVHQEPPGVLTQAHPGDARITRVGTFLRRTSLDELPQFINVLQGRMSIVGPRPHALEHHEQFKNQVTEYMKRHKVKPGITGWAQINGYRGETDTLDKLQKRIEYDLYYIEHWSLWFDLRIIILTIIKGFWQKNAY